MKQTDDGTVILEEGDQGFEELIAVVEAVLNDPDTEVFEF
jgi:hypothetical protein